MRLTKKLCDELKQAKGEICGAVLSTDMRYILSHGTTSDLQMIEGRLKALGCQFRYGNIKNTDWYSLGLRLASFLLVIQHFNLDDKGIKQMGMYAPNVSPMLKLYIKYFGNINIFTKNMSAYWKKHYTVGKLELVEMNKKTGKIKVHIKGFYEPINNVNKEVARLYILKYLEGYFESVTKMLLGDIKGHMKEAIIDDKHVYEFITKF